MDGLSRNTLPKKERLCGKKGIEKLLAKGRYGNVPGLRFCCLSGNGSENSRIMVSVPKKLFKRAVKRNLLKRRMRESYRRLKHELNMSEAADILFTYSTKEIMSYEEIYASMAQAMDKIRRMSGKNIEE